MGTFSPSEVAAPNTFRQWQLALLLFVPLAFCGLITVVGATRYAIPEVQPAYPTAQLISEQTTSDERGFQTVRIYQVPQIEMRDVLEWYFNEDIIGRYGPHAVQPTTFEYVFVTPTPNQPLAPWLLARYSQVKFAARDGNIEVTSTTRFYWRILR